MLYSKTRNPPSEEEIKNAESVLKKKNVVYDNTICQIIRDIYQMTDNRVIQGKCLIAFSYAKRMDTKLREYKRKETL